MELPYINGKTIKTISTIGSDGSMVRCQGGAQAARVSAIIKCQHPTNKCLKHATVNIEVSMIEWKTRYGVRLGDFWERLPFRRSAPHYILWCCLDCATQLIEMEEYRYIELEAKGMFPALSNVVWSRLFHHRIIREASGKSAALLRIAEALPSPWGTRGLK